MQWRHPLSLALTTPPVQTPPSPPVTQINTNSSIPFRELLLQQQQLHQQRQQQQQHQQSQLSKVNETKPKLTSTSPTIPVSDSDRSALASHFHERDRMILQHQQQQMQLQQQLLQQQQTHQQEQMHQIHHQTELQQRHLEQREKCLINNNDRLQDYDVSDREKELAIRLKSPGTFSLNSNECAQCTLYSVLCNIHQIGSAFISIPFRQIENLFHFVNNFHSFYGRLDKRLTPIEL